MGLKRISGAAAALLFALVLGGSTGVPGYHLVPGGLFPDRGPDGNSVFIDAPDGLILVDTGRHTEHLDRLLGYARSRGRPVAALVNTHWHLDHTSGNAEIRAAYPGIPVYASRAIEGALRGLLARNRATSERNLASGTLPPDRAARARRFLAVMANPDALRPSVYVTRSGRLTIAGREFEVNLAPFAATEADVWLYDPAGGVVVAGDLVVAMVPFLDTACPEGWRRALDEIARRPFHTLIPGHGEAMDRAGFMLWRTAFNNLLDCAADPARGRDACVAGWRRDAAPFIAADDAAGIDEAVGDYLDTRLRQPPEERDRFCRAGSQ